MAVSYDFDLDRGTNVAAVRWDFVDAEGVPLPLTGDVVLTLSWPGDGLAKDSAEADGLAVGATYAIWTPTVAESRRVPPGKVTRYEIEHREGGEQRRLGGGWITGLGGLDADD